MNTLKKALAAISSFALAFALAVPAVSWADTSEEGSTNSMALRLSCNGQMVELCELPSVPHSLSLTFGVEPAYAGYAGAMDRILELSEAMRGMRVADVEPSMDGTFSIALSNGNDVLPLTDGLYLDLGALDVSIDGVLDESSDDAALMKQAVITISALSVVDSENVAIGIVPSAQNGSTKTVVFELGASAFKGGADGGALPDPGDEPDGYPVVDAPIVNVPDDVTAPSDEEVNEAVSGIAISALWSIWNGEEAEGISEADQSALKAFLDKVKAAGYSFEDLKVQYKVDVKHYDSIEDVPEADLALLQAAFGDKYFELGYYDLNVTMTVSLPKDSSLGSASAAVRELDAPLSFTVEVASGLLANRVASVGYVHDGKLSIITDDVVSDAKTNTVTFPAAKFSTYGVYAADELAKNGGNPPVAAGLASTGDDARTPIMLLVGAVVLCGALAVVLMRPRVRSHA